MDVLIGNYKKQVYDPEVTASQIFEEPEQEDEESSEDDSHPYDAVSQSPLSGHMSQLISQTITFSFYVKKKHSNMSLIPCIGISKSHIQFHFYDSENDVYLISREMPLFCEDDRLNLPSVLATWLVLNYTHLMSDVPVEMKNQFGFHQLRKKMLSVYKNKISIGPLKSGPFKFYDTVLRGTKRYQPVKERTATIEAKYARKSVPDKSQSLPF